MRVLFISSCDMMAANIASIIKKEGHDVKLFIDDYDRKLNFENIVDKTDDWKAELKWVGKDGLVVFDDVGYGKLQDQLRLEGYSVFGGCEEGDKLELNREFAQRIFFDHGIKTVPTIDFDDVSECIDFVRENKKAWVIKQNGTASKSFNYVPFFDDGSDTLEVLEHLYDNNKKNTNRITLQEKITGIEIGVGRYFNGSCWVGPIEMNIEHKKFFPGDIGPMTSEMGTVIWYDDNENNKLFKETIDKLTPYLKKINFKGDFEINCIVNENGAFPLEATPRFGSPAIYLQDEIHASQWAYFLKDIADGKNHEIKWQRGFGVVVLLAIPPFPYAKKMEGISAKGTPIFFRNGVYDREYTHLHFEGVARNEKGYFVSDEQGYVLYVTSIMDSVEDARKKVYDIIENIHIPKMIYRIDIGENFDKIYKEKLKSLGYL